MTGATCWPDRVRSFSEGAKPGDHLLLKDAMADGQTAQPRRAS